MKSNFCTLAFFLEAYDRNCFRFLVDYDGYQVSHIISLFCNYPPTTILDFTFSILPSYCIFYLYTSIHGVASSSFLVSSIINILLLIKRVMSFKVAFSQSFLTSSDNIMTSEIPWLWNKMGHF